MRKFIYYFIQGLFYTVPLGITIYVVYSSISFLDKLLPIDIPGLGLLTMIVLITLFGYLGSVVLSSSVGKLIRNLEKFVLKIPGIKLIYTALKDLTSALTGTSKTFEQAVLVTLDKENDVQKIGFVTKNDLGAVNIGPDKVSVYFPYSYGIMGDLKIVPKDSVVAIPGKPAEIMKFIVSGGVVHIGEETEDQENP